MSARPYAADAFSEIAKRVRELQTEKFPVDWLSDPISVNGSLDVYREYIAKPIDAASRNAPGPGPVGACENARS